ncbi:hypothetical protein [Microbacterium sp. MYb64]|uniref:MmyB family transcriptional regulator n=1 Tax=Microbacterium sp. MYb64 TaxID=1848691 RepID=UPI002157AAA5|nr:hypothetical protein [Microbacterium sp. MYb64]
MVTRPVASPCWSLGGSKRLRHPEIGELELGYEVLHLPEGNGQRILTHTAEPGSASAAALRLLSSTI